MEGKERELEGSNKKNIQRYRKRDKSETRTKGWMARWWWGEKQLWEREERKKKKGKGQKRGEKKIWESEKEKGKTRGKLPERWRKRQVRRTKRYRKKKPPRTTGVYGDEKLLSVSTKNYGHLTTTKET